ncbi:MAG: hypothetical protein L0216_06605 [Planctomycetales bacterium]|nr:hypothetical protein [Planctomycetales bacterium]
MLSARRAAPALASLALAAATAVAQEPAAGTAEVVDPSGKRVREAQVVFLRADVPAPVAARAILGLDLARTAREGTTVLAAGEECGQAGLPAPDLPREAVVQPASEGIADIRRVPAATYLVLAGAPGFLPATAVGYEAKGDMTPGLRLKVEPVGATLVRQRVVLKWDTGLAPAASVWIRAVPARPEAGALASLRPVGKRVEARWPGITPGEPAPPPVEEGGSSVGQPKVRASGELCAVAAPVHGDVVDVLVSPGCEVTLLAGPGVAVARFGKLALGAPLERKFLLRRSTPSNTRTRVRVAGPHGKPLRGATVYLFAEGGKGFARAGMKDALDSPASCLEALRAARRWPAERDLDTWSARGVTVDGTVPFDGLLIGAYRVVVEMDGYAQREAPVVEVPVIPPPGGVRDVTAPVEELAGKVGVLRLRVLDPLGGPLSGDIRWALTAGESHDSGSGRCHDGALTLYVPPSWDGPPDVSVVVSTVEQGGLAGQSAKVSVPLGKPVEVAVRLEAPRPSGGK